MRANCLTGVSPENIVKWTGVHITTARRWKRYGDFPLTAEIVVLLKTTGDLGLVDREWTGWRLVSGELVAPDQARFSPQDILAGPFWRTLARSYQVEQRFPRQADWVDERWIINEQKETPAETGVNRGS